MNLNKVLNIIAWIVFALSIVSYIADDLGFEAIYFAAAAIFLVIAPRSFGEAFN